MGMSTHIIGFKPPDAKWKRMKKIYDACIEADIEIPKEVDDFFEGVEPDNAGVQVEIEELACTRPVEAEMQTGFEVDVDKLPADVKIIRFYNCY